MALPEVDETGVPMAVEAAVRRLRQDVQDFWSPLHRIPRMDASELSPLRFHREFVSRSVPVVITNAMESPQWRHAREQWQSDAYLVQKAGDAPVTVDVTPFGLGDVVLELDGHPEAIFVMPEERQMTMEGFLQVFRDREGFDGVPYLSHQNDSLRDEFPELYEDVPAFLELGKEAFGNDPDAVNIWIGDERAVSSMHKDHYENLYCVVTGQKHFTLLPPADVACLYEREYPSNRYRHEHSPPPADEHSHNVVDLVATRRFHDRYPQHASWRIHSSPDTGDTPWIPVDPLKIDSAKFPLAALLNPIEIVVNAGEVLYLPAMWYHRAAQLCPTISVNYWHDMEFDCRYVYFNLAHELGAIAATAATTSSSHHPQEVQEEDDTN